MVYLSAFRRVVIQISIAMKVCARPHAGPRCQCHGSPWDRGRGATACCAGRVSLAHRRHRGGVARRQRRQYGKVRAQGCWMDRSVTIWAPVIREVDIWSAVTTWSVSCALSLRTYPCVGERCLSSLSSIPPGPGNEHKCVISGGIHQWCAQRARYYQLVIRSASFNTLGVCECSLLTPPLASRVDSTEPESYGGRAALCDSS